MAFFRVCMPASKSVMTREISGPATAHYVKTHSSLRLRVAPCIFSYLFCCSVFGWIQSLRKGFAFWQWWTIHQSWVFHSHVHHFAHVHREPASVDLVIVDTYITNAMLWIVDDNSITRYTKCSVFPKLLIYAPCVINVLRSAPNVVLPTRMTLNVTFKTSCWPIMSKIVLPLNLSLRRNHIKWYYMIWL